MPERFMKKVFIDAIEFVNTPETHQAISEFTGMQIAVEYTSKGVQLRVIRGAFSVLIAQLGEYIVKEADGSLRVCTREGLEEEGYALVEEVAANA